MQTTAFTGIGRREPVRYMVPLPAAEARRDRLSGKIAHLYNDSFAHEFAIQQVVSCTRRDCAACVLTLPGNGNMEIIMVSMYLLDKNFLLR